MARDSLDEGYFDRLYAQSEDPWDFRTSPYEAEKYARTIAHLGERRYASALEIGCSIGVLTRMLAERCDALLALDINERALARARLRNFDIANVSFERATIPRDFPAGRFDLVVLSEVAYYWNESDLRAAKNAIARAASGGVVELVHFLPEVDEYLSDGDAVHEVFLADARFTRTSEHRAERYRLDVFAVA